MKNEMDSTKAEQKYLKDTLAFLKDRLAMEQESIGQKKEDIIAFRREMYANSTADAQDMGKLAEAAQYLTPLMVQTMDYHALEQQIALFTKMLKNPYFARIDFTTDRWGAEVVYIGLGNLEDEDSFDVYVYDWRAPISSVFYRFELGSASYKAPTGLIEGEVTLKRQFEITDGTLHYFFDSGVNITDSILKEALSKNSSQQMRTIVETIQREQDIIIRDMENELVIVQGVAGSGKTSIALHRVAYLMYQGLHAHLSSKNIILVSPNSLFEQYVSHVLPELGEDNIQTVTFEAIYRDSFGEDAEIQSKNQALEVLLVTTDPTKRAQMSAQYCYKSSYEFFELLDWLINYYLHRLTYFPDLMFGGVIIAKGDLLKQRLLTSGVKKLTPKARLRQVETYVVSLMKGLEGQRLARLEKRISSHEKHSFDYKELARIVLNREKRGVLNQVKKFTRIEYGALYRRLYKDPVLQAAAVRRFPRFAEIAAQTRFSEEPMEYYDAMAVLYLRVKMDSIKLYDDIRQVMVDEVQDYSPIHFKILDHLFPHAKYTVLGDINQTLLDMDSEHLYQDLQEILGKKRSTLISLTKSFRCSFEISTFSSYFADEGVTIETLERHEEPPVLYGAKTIPEMHHEMAALLATWRTEGYGTLAIICRSMAQCHQLFETVGEALNAHLLEEGGRINLSKVIILPVYLAKGLEFDGVIVYDVNENTYTSDDDRRLLYVSCTRALHRLGVFYVGKPSPLLPPATQTLS